MGKKINFQLSNDLPAISFINMNHDFRQIIQYQMINKESLEVNLSGKIGETQKEIVIKFNKIG
jgi:hypothetical protein